MRRRLALLAASMLMPTGAALAAEPPTKPAPSPPASPAAEAGKTVEGVTVNGAQQAVRSSIDRKSYSLTGDLQATTGSIGDALRNVPGLDVDVQGNLSLRGQTVTILVDGKPSGIFRGDNAGQVLQSMGADQYERVEVITNPSAEFRPDGAGGIINLVSKKNRKPGYSSSVKVNVGSEARYNASVTGGYNADKLSVTANAAIRRDPQKFRFTRTRTTIDPDDGATARSRDENLTVGDGHIYTGSVHADYDATKKDRLSAELSYFGMRIRSDVFDHYLAEDLAGAPIGAYDLLGRFDLNVDATTGQATWKHSFADDHDLTVNLSQEHDLQSQHSPDVVSTHLPVAGEVYENNRFRGTTDETDLKVDYVRPMPDQAKLKAGYELDAQTNDYDSFGARGPSLPGEAIDPSRTNVFIYKQAVNAAYGSYERPIGDLTVLAGLRLEQTDIDINQVTSAIKASNDYFRLYPSLHLSYRLGDGQTLTGSYSRRVQRPNPFDLNPYRVYLDPFNYRQGNPYLRPQTTDSLELGYEVRRNGVLYQATVFYRRHHDVFTDVIEDLGDGVLLTTRQNLGSAQNAGVQLVANGKLTKTLSYNISGEGYWNEINAGNLGFEGTRSAWTVGGRANLNWQATKDDFVQVNGSLTGKRLNPQGYREPLGMLNLGYRHKVDERLSAVVTVRDLLGTSKQKVVENAPTFHDKRVIEPNVRAVFVGLTYSFGGAGKKAPRDSGFDFGGGAAGAPGGPS
jgi:outer membrane receptor protein involved in Fe transport